MTYQWHTSDPACMVTPLISEIKCRASSWFRTQNSKGGVVWESYWNHIIQQIHHDICDDIDISLSKKERYPKWHLKVRSWIRNVSFQRTTVSFQTGNNFHALVARLKLLGTVPEGKPSQLISENHERSCQQRDRNGAAKLADLQDLGRMWKWNLGFPTEVRCCLREIAGEIEERLPNSYAFQLISIGEV